MRGLMRYTREISACAAGCALLLLSLLGPKALADEQRDGQFTLESLMRALSEVESIDAAFRETRTVAVLNEPVILTGVLRYRAPDYVLKKVLLPRRESIEISGDQLFIDSSEDGTRSLRLEDYPAIGAFVESFRATLAGDLDSLRRHYRAALEGTSGRWRLRLEPIEPAIAEHVDAILIRGSASRVLRIETRQTDGSRSVMTITPVNQ